MRYFRCALEQKDYGGYGGAFYTRYIEAENEDEAEEKARHCMCGIESVWIEKEISQEQYESVRKKRA